MWAAVAALTGVGEREEEGTGKRGQAVSGSVLGQGSGGGCWADALRAARGWARAEGGKQRSWAGAEEWASRPGQWEWELGCAAARAENREGEEKNNKTPFLFPKTNFQNQFQFKFQFSLKF